MTIAEQQREEARIYREMVPRIVESLLTGEEPVGASQRLAEQFEMDRALVYKWFQLTEADLERHRKKYAWRHVIPLWVAAAGMAALVVAALSGVLSLTGGWPPWALGFLVVVEGAIGLRLFGLKRRAYYRRLRKLSSDEEVAIGGDGTTKET